MRLLIVLPGALGDVIRALPLLGRVRRHRPRAWIAWAVEPLSAPLLEGHPWLDEVVVVPRRAGGRALVAAMRRLAALRPEVALDLGRGAKSALLTLASRAGRRLGFARPDAREGAWLASTERIPVQGRERSKLEQFLAFGDLLGIPASEVAFGLEPTPAESGEAARTLARLGRPVVAVSLGSSCPARRWFPDRTAALVDALRAECGASSLLLGTVDDRRFAAAVVAGARHAPLDLTGRTTLRELLALLAGVDAVVGPDSGTLHLAAALGRRVVSLWGATSAARSAPWGSEDLVVEGRVPCSPCFLRRCPIGRECMRRIGAEEVAARAREALG